MQINIYYVIAAFIIIAVINVIHLFFYSGEGDNHLYRTFIRIVACSCVFDIISAIGMEFGAKVPDIVNTVFNTLSLIAHVFSHYYALRALCMSIGFESKISNAINNFVAHAAMVILILNIALGNIFTFEDGVIVKKDLYVINYYICIWFILAMTISVILSAKRVARNTFWGSFVAILVLVVTFVVQQKFPDILFLPLGLVIVALLLCFTLETPDYERLQYALEELEYAREQEAQGRELLEISNAEKAEFLENMSHELRTPINAIMGFDKLIQLDDVSDDIKQRTRSIMTASNKLVKLVEDILDYSQIETSRLEIQAEEYETVSLYTYNVSSDDVYLDCSIPQRLYGDANRLRQILDNIYTYSKEQAPNSSVFFELSNLGIGDEYVRLKFAYRIRGLGLSLDQLNRLNEHGFDEDIISITIANMILNNMESELRIISDYENETLFSFELSQRIVDIKPLGVLSDAWMEYENHQLEQTNSTELEFRAPDVRILGVDDVKLNLMVLGGLLSKFKVQFSKANSGAEAIKYMEENPVDLVFMDIMMPDMDGVETLYNIKSDPDIVSKNAPIIALTANVTAGAKEEYLSDGFDGYMSKPIDIKKIGALIRYHLSNKIEEDWDEIIGIDQEGKAL